MHLYVFKYMVLHLYAFVCIYMTRIYMHLYLFKYMFMHLYAFRKFCLDHFFPGYLTRSQATVAASATAACLAVVASGC